MTPIYLEFLTPDGPWSALLHPDQGRCDLWRDQAYVGTVTFGRGGLEVSADHLRSMLPILAEQLRPYYPLLRHEGRITASGRLPVARAAMAASA